MNMVYCFKYPETGLCKLGFTSCALVRLRSLHPSYGVPHHFSPMLLGKNKLVKQLEKELLNTFQHRRLNPNDVRDMGRFTSGMQGTTECFEIDAYPLIEREMLRIVLSYSQGDVQYLNLGAYLSNMRSEVLDEVIELKANLKAALSNINYIVRAPHGSPIRKK